jgi:hypothetical protein
MRGAEQEEGTNILDGDSTIGDGVIKNMQQGAEVLVPM